MLEVHGPQSGADEAGQVLLDRKVKSGKSQCYTGHILGLQSATECKTRGVEEAMTPMLESN